MDFAIRFDPPRAGWILATVRSGDAEATIEGSFLSDCLGDLLEATACVSGIIGLAQCTWPQEPGEYRWMLARHGADLHVQIFYERQWSAVRATPANEYERPVFEARTSLLRFVRALMSESQRLLDDVGVDVYERESRHPFPLAALERLRGALRSARGTKTL